MSRKRKGTFDHVKDMMGDLKKSKLESAEIKAKSRVDKEQLRIDGQREALVMQMAQERERWAHEKEMMDKQMAMKQLELQALRLRSGVDPSLPF